MTAIASRTEAQPQLAATIPELRPAPRECSHMGCHVVGEYAHPAGQGLRACLSHFLVAAGSRS